MNNLSQKVNDPNDSSFDLQGIINSVSGGNIGSLINQFTNNNADTKSSNRLIDAFKKLF